MRTSFPLFCGFDDLQNDDIIFKFLKHIRGLEYSLTFSRFLTFLFFCWSILISLVHVKLWTFDLFIFIFIFYFWDKFEFYSCNKTCWTIYDNSLIHSITHKVKGQVALSFLATVYAHIEGD